ncbi:hypothetical protein EPA93_07995 [Ktedonosporobacter rubrisoli]|uniref:Uncharacterized protein n=1 Tax=Ktedonosporobacter rubrisoli TaxID=2509675 RepID=A0A4V0YYE6_KTERU|nr:hypothetical protein [Ktedonosporobacter rubrisoli]QBD75951.1 hypothetical protein EPA93_07995 [Ktedonosporobacter rubrisoli]
MGRQENKPNISEPEERILTYVTDHELKAFVICLEVGQWMLDAIHEAEIEQECAELRVQFAGLLQRSEELLKLPTAQANEEREFELSFAELPCLYTAFKAYEIVIRRSKILPLTRYHLPFVEVVAALRSFDQRAVEKARIPGVQPKNQQRNRRATSQKLTSIKESAKRQQRRSRPHGNNGKLKPG